MDQIITVKICIVLINYVNVQCWSDSDVFYVDLRLSVTCVILRVRTCEK